MHKHYHAAEIRAELVRFPSAAALDLDVIVSGPEMESDLTLDGECCVLDMLVGFLQRRVQSHVMLHRQSTLSNLSSRVREDRTPTCCIEHMAELN